MCRCFPFYVQFGLKKNIYIYIYSFLHVGNSALERRLKDCLRLLPPKQQQQKPSRNPHSSSAVLRGVGGDLLRPPGPLLIQTQMHGPGVVHVWARWLCAQAWGRLPLSRPSLSAEQKARWHLAVPTVDPQLVEPFPLCACP